MANALDTFCVMLEPQEGGTYDEIVSLAQKAEALGFEGFFRSDHYQPVNSNIPLEAVSTECWSTMAGLARDTKRVRLGTMISPMTFRYPGEFAKIVATVDQMSGGRIEVGMGGGWNKREHESYGLPFPDAKGRLDILEDTLEICTRLWSDGVGHSYEGRVFSIKDSPGSPKPVQRPHPPIIIGGGGPKRTPTAGRAVRRRVQRLRRDQHVQHPQGATAGGVQGGRARPVDDQADLRLRHRRRHRRGRPEAAGEDPPRLQP